MKYNPGFILWLFKSSAYSVNSHIVSLSLLLFIAVARMSSQSHTYMTYIYLFPLMYLVGNTSHISEYMFPSFVIIRSTVVKKKMFLLLSSRSVYGGFSMVDFSPCLIMCMCPIVVFLDFSICLLISFLWDLAKSSGNLVWLSLGGLLLLGWKMLYEGTVIVLV